MSILRAGLYERVSTEEQALKGYSIETQKDILKEYCIANDYKIVDHYTDEGISGAKPPLKRPALKRLIDDVQAGKIDIILFTKLDRWFRNVQEYYKVQEILDSNRVNWKTVLEDYNTDTADGRLKVNIMLSVAANERERTGERISVVFNHKVKNREACQGGKPPKGYIKVKDENGIKRYAKDPETQEWVQEFWDLVKKWEQVNKAGRYINNKYGLNRASKQWFDIVKTELYSGEYRGVKDYCEPYIDRETWEKLQVQKIKQTQKDRVYLFTGLLRCPNCGRSMAATYNTAHGKEYRRYRCVGKQAGVCDYNTSVSEPKVEQFLLENLPKFINEEVDRVELEQSAPKPKPKTNVNALKERLRKLNVAYMAENMTDEEYLSQSAEIKKIIAEAEKEELPEARDLTPLKEVLETDVLSLYETFTLEEKRYFWRSIVKELIVEKTNIKEVIFL